MLSSMLSLAHGALDVSLLGFFEVVSVFLVAYYIYAKTRVPALVAGLFPNLKIDLNYRSSFAKLNNEFVLSKRNSKLERKPVATLVKGTRNMLQITPHAGSRPYSGLDWGDYFPHLAQCIRTKKFSYPQVSSFVSEDPVLNRTIKQAAEQALREELKSKPIEEDLLSKFNDDEYNAAANNNDVEIEETYRSILQKQEKRSESILMNMRSTLNHFLICITSWIMYKLLPCFLRGVITHTEQIKMLKLAAEKSPGTPLIFIPLHRSHLDYIMVTFILTNNDIRSPLVAAGNNLQIPIFGGLLRGLGAFFIKRKIDRIVGKKDLLYRAVLNLYVKHALKLGHNIEFFIEGGRTRTGKPCMPKGGILSIIINAFMDNSIPDALLVPVSVNYERLVDGNFVREQRGESKVPESFGKAIRGIWKALNSNYGSMRIDFNEPYSLRELVQSYNKVKKNYTSAQRTLQHNHSTSSLYGTDVVCEEHRALIDSISRQLVYDCADATSVMSTNALAFLLLTQFRKGATLQELTNGLDNLRKRLFGRKDIGFAGESIQIINYACDLLGKDLILRTRNEAKEVFVQPVNRIESFIELSYYSNMLAPHFALMSLVLITFHKLLPSKETVLTEKIKPEELGATRNRLVQKALENCDILCYEFILNKPTQTLEDLLERAVDNMMMNCWIRSARIINEPVEYQESRRLAQKMARYIDDESDDDDAYTYGNNGGRARIIEKPDIFLVNDTLDDQRHICEVLAPFSYTYYTVALALEILYDNSMLETEFIGYVIRDLNNKYQTGINNYAESISTDSIRNCVKLFEKWSVIEIGYQHGLRIFSLSKLYCTSKDSLNGIVERLAAIVPNYDNDYF